MTVGTRAQVWHGTADRTAGGLTKKDLFMKNGRIRSKRASRSAKNNKNLKKAGWTFKKGEFGAVRVDEKEGEGKKRTARRSAKRSAKRSARRSAKRSAGRVARRSARRSAGRVARRSAKRSARRSAKRSAGRVSRRRQSGGTGYQSSDALATRKANAEMQRNAKKREEDRIAAAKAARAGESEPSRLEKLKFWKKGDCPPGRMGDC